MDIKKIETLEEFKNIKKGDLILVQWSDFIVQWMNNCEKIMLYEIQENREEEQGIVCNGNNHYFNYERQLRGLSNAKEVYLVSESGEENE